MNDVAESSSGSLIARAIGALPNGVRYVSLIFYAYVVVMVGLFANEINYWFYVEITKENVPVFLVLGIVVGAALTLVVWLARRLHLCSWLAEGRRFLILVGIGTVGLVALQALIYHGLQFEITKDIEMLTQVEDYPAQSEYFSRYPHQLFLAGIFVLLHGLANLLGCSAYGLYVFVGCLLVAVSVGLAALVAQKLMGVPAALVVFVVGAYWLGCSPTTLSPYTDAYGMVCPTLVLFLYVCMDKGILKWGLMGFVAVIGYYLKAYSLAVFAAIVFVELCLGAKAALNRRKQEDPERRGAKGFAAVGKKIGACLVGIGLAFGLAQAVRSIPDVEIDPNKELGVTHYLMLGVNEMGGIFHNGYYEYSTSFPTVEARVEANLQMWRQRLEILWPQDIPLLTAMKTLTAFGDGSFRWRGGGIDYVKGTNEPLLAFYGLDEMARQVDADGRTAPDALLYSYDPWDYIAQVLWDGLLVGCALCMLKRRVSKAEMAMTIALLLLGVYLLIFEVGPRYPFILTPLFLLLGVQGWARLAQTVHGFRERRAESSARMKAS